MVSKQLVMLKPEHLALDAPSSAGIAKNTLETIVLSMLSERPMCINGLIKEIYFRHHIFLSLKTMYDVLCFLKEHGIIHVMFTGCNMREIYTTHRMQAKMVYELEGGIE